MKKELCIRVIRHAYQKEKPKAEFIALKPSGQSLYEQSIQTDDHIFT